MKRAKRLTSFYACNGVAHPLEVSIGIATLMGGAYPTAPTGFFDYVAGCGKVKAVLRTALHDLFGTMADEGRAFKTFLKGKLTCK